MRNLFLFTDQHVGVIIFFHQPADNYAMVTEKRYNDVPPYRKRCQEKGQWHIYLIRNNVRKKIRRKTMGWC